MCLQSTSELECSQEQFATSGKHNLAVCYSSLGYKATKYIGTALFACPSALWQKCPEPLHLTLQMLPENESPGDGVDRR